MIRRDEITRAERRGVGLRLKRVQAKEATQTEFAGLSCKQERFDKKRQKRGDAFLKKTTSAKVSYNAVKSCKPLENFMVFEEEEEELPEEETV